MLRRLLYVRVIAARESRSCASCNRSRSEWLAEIAVVINGTAGNDSFLRFLEELPMDKRQSGSEDNAAIRDVVESWTAAVRRRDFGGILQNHSSDIVMFDVPPPFQSKGIDAYKKNVGLVFFLVKQSHPLRYY
jgi:hypothetical protein